MENVQKGASWEVPIPDAWELGPPGKQTVAVILADPTNHSIVLRREGQGEGFFADDKTEIPVTKGGKTYTAQVVPGEPPWVGYTTFREGVVISDELLVERPLTLISADLEKTPASEREYIFLNAMPLPSQ